MSPLYYILNTKFALYYRTAVPTPYTRLLIAATIYCVNWALSSIVCAASTTMYDNVNMASDGSGD
eukprot:scaffold366801_cov24-Prasinocladus_malaysianus.AAC.1